jgi:hypothetical protein
VAYEKGETYRTVLFLTRVLCIGTKVLFKH